MAGSSLSGGDGTGRRGTEGGRRKGKGGKGEGGGIVILICVTAGLGMETADMVDSRGTIGKHVDYESGLHTDTLPQLLHLHKALKSVVATFIASKRKI